VWFLSILERLGWILWRVFVYERLRVLCLCLGVDGCVVGLFWKGLVCCGFVYERLDVVWFV